METHNGSMEKQNTQILFKFIVEILVCSYHFKTHATGSITLIRCSHDAMLTHLHRYGARIGSKHTLKTRKQVDMFFKNPEPYYAAEELHHEYMTMPVSQQFAQCTSTAALCQWVCG